MDRFLTVKKRTLENSSDSLPLNAKITKNDENFTIVSVNSNSLANRISDKKNHADFKTFVECHLPDIIAIQEVRRQRLAKRQKGLKIQLAQGSKLEHVEQRG